MVRSAKPKSRSKPATISQIEDLQGKAGNRAVSMIIARAGTPKGLPAPDGIKQILEKTIKKGTRGLTLIPNAVAFQAPAFNVTTTVTKTGEGTRSSPLRTSYSAKVEPTSGPDIEHESFYPEEGHHHIRVKAVVKGEFAEGQYTPAYAYVSGKMSQDIQAGENEHLEDAALAHRMTYGLVADEVNALAKRTAEAPFTSGQSKSDAENRAVEALASRLPEAFGTTPTEKTNPASWVKLLDRLLLKTTERDEKGWHFCEDKFTEKKHEGREVYDVVKKEGFFSVPGKRVVDY